MINLKKNLASPPADINKAEIKAETVELRDRLPELHRKLYAEGLHSLLVILQGLDTSGKNSTIRRVFTAFNPSWLHVKSFIQPTLEESQHDFLWRVHPHVPAAGTVNVFNRSYYEDVIVRVVEKEIGEKELKRRYSQINDFERLLKEDQGTCILKFFLHISEEQQVKRVDDRKNIDRKKWKYTPADEKNIKKRNRFLAQYEDVFSHTSEIFPWEVIPSDKKWYRDYLIIKRIYIALNELNPRYPDFNRFEKA